METVKDGNLLDSVNCIALCFIFNKDFPCWVNNDEQLNRSKSRVFVATRSCLYFTPKSNFMNILELMSVISYFGM